MEPEKGRQAESTKKGASADTSADTSRATSPTMVAERVGNSADALRSYQTTSLAAAKQALPAVPPLTLTRQFQPLVDLTYGTLEARLGIHSSREYRLTLKDVQPGQTQERLEALVAEINPKLQKMENCPPHYKVRLDDNRDLRNFRERGDVVFICSSIIQDSERRHPTETIFTHESPEKWVVLTLSEMQKPENQDKVGRLHLAGGFKKRCSMKEHITELGLFEQPNDVVRVIAGMFRLAKGFPADERYIGTGRDDGDAFEGMVAMTKPGPYSYSVSSGEDGIGHGFHPNGQSLDVGAVGGYPAELRQPACEGLARQSQAETSPGRKAPQAVGVAKAPAELTQEYAETLITEAGGIFLGGKQLKGIAAIDGETTIPPIPREISREFLDTRHPLGGGPIKANLIVGFDPDTNAWYCFEKKVVRGSLGPDARGIKRSEMKQLLLDKDGKPRIVGEMMYSSPTDYRPFHRVLENVIKLLLQNNACVDHLPFYDMYGVTADTQNAENGGCILLGFSHREGAFTTEGGMSEYADYANHRTGLFGCWEKVNRPKTKRRSS